jgi:WD40 repeat protein
MKFKKRSTQKRQRQRQHLLKRGLRNSILQHGGGFMDMMTSLEMEAEGQSYTSMSVHSTKPLIVTGNNTGELILWKINTESPPKKLAVLIGLPRTAVKFTEFHKTLSIIAAGCSDKVLMWSYQGEEGQEDVVQQLQPSHTVFSLKSEDDLEREIGEVQTNLTQMEKISDELYHELYALKGNEIPIDIRRKKIYAEIDSKKRDIKKNQSALKNLRIEINNLKQKLQNEVSCIAFHPNKPYIAVGLNNRTTNVSSRFVMYTFDPESIKASYDIIPAAWNPRNDVDVLMASFSSDGNMFAYIVVPIQVPIQVPIHSNREGRVIVQNFYTDDQQLELFERKTYRIPGRSITCITPCKSIQGFHDGTRYPNSGVMMTHEFLIGCDDGSVILINAITVHPSRANVKTIVQEVIHSINPITKSVYEWNGGRDKITCLAIHPSLSLPLFASGSHDAAKLWEFESNKELETLPLQDVISVGFNDKFLAVCGSGDVRVYSCNSDDYGGLKQKKLERKERLDKLHNELRKKTLKDQCAICFGPMTDQTQPAITSGPEEVVETYLPCNHKFHEKCIKQWLKQGNTCPECRAKDGLPQSTPANVVTKRRGELAKLETEFIESDERNREARRALFASPASPASPASSASPAYDQSGVSAPSSTELSPQDQSGGRKKNKKNKSKKSKKSKKRNYYSKKIKNK